ncbi:MAG TPA: hypothetical protein VD788_11440 [Candidatus Polarisedimenticolaceae bacterium]|nr:hypothetical protein [Candidatus Polarisedimenticolaceae bacterium]
MARRSRTSILKRQRELRKAEKAAQKRARRHGVSLDPMKEPVPTVSLADLLRAGSDRTNQEPDDDGS